MDTTDLVSRSAGQRRCDELHADAAAGEMTASQFLPPELVLVELAEAGAERAIRRTVPEIVVLSMLAGGFITVGALFSVLLGSGTDNEGVQRLLEGFGFSTGFFVVVLSGTMLFTEINVEMPATLLRGGAGPIAGRIGRLWGLTAIGNLAGAVAVGLAVHLAQSYSPQVHELLAGIVEAKMRYREVGGAPGWFEAVLSGVLGNWLVGMAAFLSVMGRTIIGKYIPILITVSAFVAAGFMHSPANMAFFALATPEGIGPGWGQGLLWSIIPAAIGNIAGAFFLVALPFWFVNRCRERATGAAASCKEA